MGKDGDTYQNEQKAAAKGKGSLAINAAAYSSVTVFQYVTYEGGKASTRETTDPAVCPYPGLETFHTSEANYFAGREEDIALLEAKLKDHDICGIIAASGAGKSSLIHAGLIPALAKRDSEAWDVFAFKPGQAPLYGLARSMSGILAHGDNLDDQLNDIRRNVESLRTTPGRLSEYIEETIRRRAEATQGKRHHTLIFIDQWEELYTRENDQDRDILVRELKDVADRGLAKVLLTMRIDFMEEMLLLGTDFFRTLKPGIQYLEPMDELGLRSVIKVPAAKVGLEIPEALTSRLIVDLGKGRDHGSLPYLQFVLRQLWEKRDQTNNSLTTKAYDDMKGLKGAIGAHADAVFRKLSKQEQSVAERILPRLANVSEARTITSRRLPFTDFEESGRSLLRKLAEPERRLIVLSSATEQVTEAEIVAEVAHEAILDDWQTLLGWLIDRKEFFRLRNKFETDAKNWIENRKRNDFLIPVGKPLFDAKYLMEKALAGDTSKNLENFVKASDRRASSRKRQTATLISAVICAIIGISIYLASLNNDLNVSNDGLAKQTSIANDNLKEANRLGELAKKRGSDLERALAQANQANRLSEARLENVLANQIRFIAAETKNQAAIDPDGARERLLEALPSRAKIETWNLKSAVGSALRAVLKFDNELLRLHVQAEFAKFSPNGKLIVTASSHEGIVQLWDAKSGDELWSVDGNGQKITTIQFSPTGKLIAFSHSGGWVQVVATQTGESITNWNERKEPARFLTFSPDGEKVVTVTADGALQIRFAENGKEEFLLKRNAEDTTNASFSADGKYVVATSFDNFARVWKTDTGVLLSEYNGKKLFSNSLGSAIGKSEFSPINHTILSHSMIGKAVIWDAKTGKTKTLLKAPTSLLSAAKFSNDGKYVLLALLDNTVRVLDAKTGLETSLFSRHQSSISPRDSPYLDIVHSLATTSDGKLAVSVAADGTGRIWEPATGFEKIRLVGHTDTVDFVDISSNDARILTASSDGTVRVWNAFGYLGKIAEIKGDYAFILKSRLSPNGKQLLTTYDNGDVRLHDVETSDEIKFTGCERHKAKSAIFVGNREVLSYGTLGMCLWNIENPQAVKKYNHRSIRLVANTAEGLQAVAWDNTNVSVFDLTAGKIIFKIPRPEKDIYSANLSPDGKKVVVTTGLGSAWVYSTSTKELISVFQGHGKSRIGHKTIYAAAFSPDSNSVATVGADKVARLWKVQDAEELMVFKGHREWVRTVGFSYDGNRLVTASQDETARIWDIDTGDELAVLETEDDRPTVSQFSPDGSYVVVASSKFEMGSSKVGGSARIWDVSRIPAVKDALATASLLSYNAFSNQVAGPSYLSLWPAQTRDDVNDCDLLTADPIDPNRPKGVVGNLTRESAEEAVAACESAIKSGSRNARFHYQLGRAFLMLDKYVDALEHFETAHRSGYNVATIAVAKSIIDGWGTERDENDARNLLIGLASSELEGIAEYHLGWMDWYGMGLISPDTHKAMSRWKRAANLGTAEAHGALSWYFRDDRDESLSDFEAALFHSAMATRLFEKSGDISNANVQANIRANLARGLPTAVVVSVSRRFQDWQVD